TTTANPFSVAALPAPATAKIALVWAPECAPTAMATGDPTGSPSANRWTDTSTGLSPGLKTPTLVRKPWPDPPLRGDVRTDFGTAADGESPGTNMPTVGSGTVEKRRLVTTSRVGGPSNTNSTPPALLGAANVPATMSSNARASRGARVNVNCGGVSGQA